MRAYFVRFLETLEDLTRECRVREEGGRRFGVGIWQARHKPVRYAFPKHENTALSAVCTTRVNGQHERETQ